MTKFNDATRAKLKEALSKGAPYELACNYAGISYEIFRQWRKRAMLKKEADYVAFFEDLKQVEGITAVGWLEKIDSAMSESWQAAAWKLERRYFKYFTSNPLYQKDMAVLLAKMAKVMQIKGLDHEKAEEMDTESD